MAILKSAEVFMCRIGLILLSMWDVTLASGRAKPFPLFLQARSDFDNLRATRTHPVPAPHQVAQLSRGLPVQLDATQEWDVDRYQQQHNFVWEYGSSLVDLVFSEQGNANDNNLRILDVGCGSGELTAQLAKRASHVTGLDSDPQMIQKASQQFPNLKFVCTDARDFDLGEASFDVIFSNAALHWVPPDDVDKAMACIGRALKPGGLLVVELGGKGNVQSVVAAVQQEIDVLSPWYFPSIADFTTRLERVAGIETTTACLFDRPTTLRNGREGLKNWLRMFGNAFWKDLPPEMDLEDVLARIENQVRSTLWDGESWIADYRRLRVMGRKL
mmetsp:Transcript_7113/g.14046  ORF Transcript_7113/g.14046 Transcript_7113/m.14046 type:complete len:330 (-) Transcript_7113:113-1102(-)